MNKNLLKEVLNMKAEVSGNTKIIRRIIWFLLSCITAYTTSKASTKALVKKGIL